MVSGAIRQLYEFVVAVIQLREDITSCYYYTKATVLVRLNEKIKLQYCNNYMV